MLYNCGTSGHDETCLCDVVVTTPTPYIKDAVRDMWLGLEIVELRGYDNYWTDETILNYLQDLVYAKDNWARVDLGYFKPVPTRYGGSYLHTIRHEIKTRLRSMRNPSIVTVAQDLGLDWDMLMVVLFANKRTMPKEELEQFEHDVLTSRYTSLEKLGKAYRMNYKSARRLHNYWGTPLKEKDEKLHLILIDRLIAQKPEMDNSTIAKVVTRELNSGVQITTSLVRSRRKWTRNKTKNI